MGVELLLFFVLRESHSYFYAYDFVQSDSSESHNPGEEMPSIRVSCTLLSSTVSTPTVIVFLIHYSGVMFPCVRASERGIGMITSVAPCK